MFYKVFIPILICFSFSANAQQTTRTFGGGGRFFYVVDTIFTDNAYLIKLTTDSTVAFCYLLDLSEKQIDSLFSSNSHKSYNDLVGMGFPVIPYSRLGIPFYVSKADNTDKRTLIHNNPVDSLYSQSKAIKTYHTRDYKIELSKAAAKSFIVCLINQGYYNSLVDFDERIVGPDMKFIRMAFPTK
jgi:hypothetical protein